MIENPFGVHLRLGGCHSQNLSFPTQPLKHFTNAVVNAVFKHSLDRKIFTVKTDGFPAVFFIQSAKPLKGFQKRRTNEFQHERIVKRNSNARKRVFCGTDDTGSGIRQGSVQIKKQKIFFIEKSFPFFKVKFFSILPQISD